MTKKPTFASTGDMTEKTITFAEIGRDLYAFTAEGDPNSGIIFGDDGVIVIVAPATPVMAAPVIERVFVRDISSNSYGNAVGLGMADVISDRLLGKIDWKPTRINSLTASTPAAIRTPVHFPTDRECLEVMLPTVGKLDLAEVTFCRIRNTMAVNRALVSENLLPAIKANPICEILEGPLKFEFDGHGDLTEIFREAREIVHA